MQNILKALLFLVIAAGWLPPRAFAAPSDVTVSEVLIEGNQRVDTAAIKAQLKKTSGTISRDMVSEDINTLYSTGFFDQVTASVVSDPGKKSYLKYTVVEKPVVRPPVRADTRTRPAEDLLPARVSAAGPPGPQAGVGPRARTGRCHRRS